MKWFYNQKIGRKLMMAFMLLSAVVAVVGFIGIKDMGHINKMADDMYEKELLGLSYIKEANVNLIYIGRAEKNLLLASTNRDRQHHADAIARYQKLLEENVEKATPLITSNKGRQLVKKINNAWETYRAVHAKIIELGMSEELQKKRKSVEMASLGEGRQTADVIDNLFTAWSKDKEKNARNASIRTTQIYNKSRSFMIALVIGSVLFGIGLGVFISRIISAPVSKLVLAAEKIAEGDLNVQVESESKDEIGMLSLSFKQMIENLRNVVGNVKDTSEKVAASSQELASTSEEIAKGTQQIAQTVDQVASGSQEQSKNVQASAAAIEQLGQAVQEVANGAQTQSKAVDDTVELVEQITKAIEHVSALSQEAAANGQQVSDVANTGGKQVSEAVVGMVRIKDATDKVEEMVKQLGESSQQIGAIVETIDDIAEQTNLLALNAAIEAARAGEHGKGFAVVADEVRKLAERSSKATGEIAELISNIQQMTNDAVEAMDIGSRQVADGRELANKAGDALNEIQQSVEGIVRQIEEMSAASQNMTSYSTEVVKAIENMSAVTEETTAAAQQMSASSTEVSHQIEQVASVSEQNAAAAEEVSATTQEQSASSEELNASAEELSAMAEELQEMVSHFKLDESGNKVTLREISSHASSVSRRRAA